MGKYSKIISYGAVIAVLAGGGIAYVHQQHAIASNKRTVKTERATANNYKNDRLQLNGTKMRKEYDSSYPNLNKITNKNRQKVQKAMNLAFNDSHTRSSVLNHQEKMEMLLGKTFGDRVLTDVEPSDGDTPFVVHGQNVSAVDHVTDCNVAYGAYNNDGSDIPVEVAVNYVTRPFNPNYEEEGMNRNRKEQTGHAVYKAILSTEDGSMELQRSYNHIDGY